MAGWLFRILHMPIGTPLPVLRPSDADGIKCSACRAIRCDRGSRRSSRENLLALTGSTQAVSVSRTTLD
jgi:hypothetical protein